MLPWQFPVQANPILSDFNIKNVTLDVSDM